VIGSGRLVSTVAAAGLVLVSAGCAGSSSAATPAVGPSASPVRPTPSPARPTVVEVTCDAGATITTTKEAVVDRDGLHLKVTNSSGLKEVYLNFASGPPDGAGGGNEVPAGTTERVLMVPPGDVYLDCSYNEGAKETAKVKVRASDPNGYYRSVTLAELGCTSTAPVDWGPGPGRGKTAEAALDALAVIAKEPRLHARLAPVGYVQSGFTSYLLEREGSPWATAVVSPRGGQYVADLVGFCF
jgi:hypothetical protein